MEGTYDQTRQPNDYHTADFGTIYRSIITTLICDKFGAEKKHTNKGSVLIFDLDKFVRACKTYELDKNEYVVDIQTKLDNLTSDGSDGSDGNNEGGIGALEKNTTQEKNISLTKSPSPSSPPSPTSKIYNIGPDWYGCADCDIKGDKWTMESHVCNGRKRKN